MASSDIDICTQALARLGQSAISSFTDGDDISTLCGNTYPDFKLAMLTAYPWRFATATRQLALIANVTPIKFQYAFQLPSDRIDAPEALYIDLSGTKTTDYEILGDQLNIDFDELWIKYLIDVPEAKWPPSFTDFVILAYAHKIAMAVTDEASLEDRVGIAAWGNVARRDGGAFRAARTVDSRRSAQRSMLEDGGPLIRAREGGINRQIIGIIE